jgi:hypothetical protein
MCGFAGKSLPRRTNWLGERFTVRFGRFRSVFVQVAETERKRERVGAGNWDFLRLLPLGAAWLGGFCEFKPQPLPCMGWTPAWLGCFKFETGSSAERRRVGREY